MSNIIRRILSTGLVLIAFFVVASLSSTVSAHEVEPVKATKTTRSHGLMQAFTPHRDSVTGELISRINNTSHERFDGWVCATEKWGSRKAHLGCLKVNLDPMGGGNWSFQFGVTTKHGGLVHYTYQASNGVWRAVAPAVH